MELIDRLRAWSHHRQGLGDPAESLDAALRAVVAVYATHPTCPLALAARTRSPTATLYRRIDKEGTGLRIPAMRRTLFLVPRENAGRIFTSVRQSPARALRPLGRHDLSTEDYEGIAKRVLAAARSPHTSARAGGSRGNQGDAPGDGAALLALRGAPARSRR